MELLDKFGDVWPPGRCEFSEAAVAELAVPVTEAGQEMEEAFENEKAGWVVWDDLLGISREINSSVGSRSLCWRTGCLVAKIALQWRLCVTLSRTIFLKTLRRGA